VIHILTLFKGSLIGIANIIPGVSGGTFALVLGIYERLLKSIGSVSTKTIVLFWKFISSPGNKETQKIFSNELKRIDALWLALIAMGAVLAIAASSRLIAFMLDHHLAISLSFFIGLIVPSIWVPLAMLKRRSWPELISCLLGTGLLIALTFLPPDSTGSNSWGLFGLFLAGAVAVSAMILPGVSGSFMLMIMGEYKTVLDAINHFRFLELLMVGLGVVVGVVGFVRLLNLLLKRYQSLTLAFLMGLILGSLWVLWPFKEMGAARKIVTGINMLPPSFGPEVLWSVVALVVGLICSAGVMLLGRESH
jgi:putative membrane protein